MRSSGAMTALAIAASLTSVPLCAATRLVATAGADSGDCTTAPCATLTYAIGQAVSGDTISVGAGSFNNGGGTIVVNKTLAVRGAQGGVDARTRSAVPESVLTAAVRLSADGAALDGFTLTCATCGVAVVTSSSFSGYSVVNNIITGNPAGVTFGSSGAMTSTLALNDIFDNNALGPGPGHYGVFTDTAVTNALIDKNRFSGHAVAQVDFVRFPPQSSATVTISNNSFPLGSGDGPAVVLIGNDGSVVSGNRVTGGAGPFGEIFVAGGDNNITVSGNSVTGSGGGGVQLHNFFSMLGSPPNGRVVVDSNTLLGNAVGVEILLGSNQPIEVHFNRIAGNTIAIHNANLSSPVNGENNWFGCNAGPSTCANNLLSAPIDLDPWLVMDISASPSTINLLQTSLVAADLRQNSDGVPIAGFPDGTPIVFSATGGSVAPLTSNTFEAAAVTTFTPSALGTATASATLDSQTVTTSIAVTANIPALSPWMLAMLAALLTAIALRR